MNEFARSFLTGCVGVAIVICAILGGISLAMYNGASQVCATHGGHWIATDTARIGGAIDRLRECKR